MNVTMESVGAKELQEDLKRISKDKVERVNKETYASGLDVLNQAKDNLKALKAWDTGNLANTLMVERTSDRSAVEVGPTAPYGPYVEYGTKPHFPPPDALEGWARRHGFKSAWPICMLINERGTKAQPYLLPAFLPIEREYFKRLKGILEK